MSRCGAAIAMLFFVVASPLSAAPAVIIVQGAAGAEAYGPQFSQWRQRWEQAAKAGEADAVTIGASDPAANVADRDALKAAIEAKATTADELWIVLLGHGTFDGKTARFNLRGPDVSAEDLAAWLKPVEAPVAIINCSSSSGPFMSALTGARRIIITATRSGHELNFSRLGDYLSRCIADPAADLDKDGQTSLLEAYLLASRQTQAWYKEEGRLATEHALIDDNGDGLGTPAEWFRGVRAVQRAKDGAPLDGPRAHQWCLVRSARERKMPAQLRDKRDALELAIEQLREAKGTMTEDAYYAKLEVLALELAELSRKIEEP